MAQTYEGYIVERLANLEADNDAAQKKIEELTAKLDGLFRDIDQARTAFTIHNDSVYTERREIYCFVNETDARYNAILRLFGDIKDEFKDVSTT